MRDRRARGPAEASPVCAGPETDLPVVCPGPADDAAETVGDDGSLDDAPMTLPTCGWPAIDQGDASPGQCRANRTLLSCILEDGSNETCISSSPASCSDPEPLATASCIMECADNEFAVTCGSPEPSASAFEPPQGLACHALVYTPEGVVFYCCPCP
jgi:hypothetical protein